MQSAPMFEQSVREQILFNFKFHYLFLFPVFSYYFSFSISVQLIKHVSLLLLLHLETDCDEVFQGKFDGVNLRKYLIDCKYFKENLIVSNRTFLI
jgi:hypothetical protein